MTHWLQRLQLRRFQRRCAEFLRQITPQLWLRIPADMHGRELPHARKERRNLLSRSCVARRHEQRAPVSVGEDRGRQEQLNGFALASLFRNHIR